MSTEGLKIELHGRKYKSVCISMAELSFMISIKCCLSHDFHNVVTDKPPPIAHVALVLHVYQSLADEQHYDLDRTRHYQNGHLLLKPF